MSAKQNIINSINRNKNFSTDTAIREIVCFGDSNTYGLIPGTWNRYEYGVRWTSILQENVKNLGYHVSEEGLCGRTTIFADKTRVGRKGTDIFPVILESHSPVDLIILMLGTNDCKTEYNATAEKIGSGIVELLELAKKYSPQSKVLLISPIHLAEGVGEAGYDPEFDAKSVWHSRQLAKVYERIARENNCYFLAASDYANPSERDREHMDEAGHQNLAKAVTKKVFEITEACNRRII